MRWDDLPESENIEDRRGEEGGGGFAGGGGGFGGLPFGGGGLGIGTIIVLGIIGLVLGINPLALIGGAQMMSGGQHQQAQAPTQQRQTGKPSDDIGRFVSRVLGSADADWKEIFAKDGQTYRAPILVLYNEVTDQACGGQAQAAMGPFYCPADRKIYLDTSFFRDIEKRFRGCDAGSASCQFAQAYVITHEVGHHVQNLLGILPKVQERQRGLSKADANRLQVMVELQADCFAGVWANRSDQKWHIVEPGDVDAAMRTAAAIGDDRLQMQARGRVVPDSFTHGTSDQRQRWFMTGFKEGTISACNTFRAANL